MLFKKTMSFYEISQKIEESKNITTKLKYCEKGLKLLPAFVSACLATDGELPPIINCRDVAPWLYMRLGDFRNSERVIKFCISCNAYFPGNGEEALVDLAKYEKTANIALAYISQYPGTLQKNIYKALSGSGSDLESLKQFTRSSLQIHKEPFQKTNRLYVAK